MIAERAYAKINLTLDVLGKRDDGYHEVDMVMQTIDLSDLIWLEETEGRHIEIDATVSHIPLDGRNIAVTAARAFMDYTEIHKGIRISIDKHIPVAAGLAGGSADAAAVLRGLNRLWGTGLSSEQLAELGLKVGSDVPFCVYGGSAVAKGRGEKLTRIEHNTRAWVVLVRPPVFVSTADVYQALKPTQYSVRSHSPEMVDALKRGDLASIRDGVYNRLADTTMSLYPDVQVMKQRFENIARLPVHMSGSGPTLFCLVKNQLIGQRIFHALRGFTKEVHLCRLV